MAAQRPWRSSWAGSSPPNRHGSPRSGHLLMSVCVVSQGLAASSAARPEKFHLELSDFDVAVV